jgi:medium-chain acyl-[acyl-carrier-protein] hydrolase
LGGLVALEAARLLAGEEKELSLLVTVSMVPPRVQALKGESEKYHLLEDDPFLEKMEKEAGVSLAPFRDPVFRRAFLPALRREVEIAEKYKPTEAGKKLDCPVLSLYGREDRIIFREGKTPEGLAEALGAWKEWTTGGFTLGFAEGGHFFLLDDPARGTALIRSRLDELEGTGS